MKSFMKSLLFRIHYGKVSTFNKKLLQTITVYSTAAHT